MLSIRDKGKGETGDFLGILPSPEALFAGQWRAIMSDDLFQERLHIIVVDETRCITEWLLTLS